MQQKCLQFHTSKSFDETLKILEKEKLEIIFKSNNCYINFVELTTDEQISWIEEEEKDMEDCDNFLKKNSGKYDSFFESIADFREQTKELVKLYQSNPSSSKISEKYEQFIKARENLNITWISGLSPLWTYHLRPKASVNCSCIIAMKGTNFVRCLAFETDSILTIAGHNATNLKSTLEKKF